MSTPEHDLAHLRPADPAGAVPDWPRRRQHLRGDVLRRTRTAGPYRVHPVRPRAVAAIGVTAALVVGAGAVASQLRPPDAGVPLGSPTVATPAAPTPGRTTGTVLPPVPAGAVRITGTAMLQQRPGAPIKMCVGAIGDSLPASCFTTVPVAGVNWDGVPGAHSYAGTTEASVTVTGLWRNGLLTVESVTEPVTTEPRSVNFPQLCTAPTGERVGQLEDGIDPSVEQIAGFQQVWVTQPTSGPYAGQTIVNLAVIGDRAAAERQVRRHFAGLLCVGTVPGPTRRDLDAARDRVQPLQRDLMLLSLSTGGLVNGHTGLELEVFLVTDEVRARIRTTVGPEIWTWTTVSGQFRVMS